MKHQQVVVDYWNMVKASFTCLLLAFSGYILIKMVQTVFWLPGHLQKNQKRLEELATQYSLDLNADKSIVGSDSKPAKEEGDDEDGPAALDKRSAELKELVEPKKQK